MALQRVSTKFLTILFLCLIVFTVGAPAAHAAIDEKGAAQLKELFTDYIKQQQQAADARASSLAAEGDVLVEPNGSYYAVTLPHLRVIYNDGSQFDIGMIAINAVPDKNDPDKIKMTVALPTPMSFINAKGQTKARLTIGSQNLSGIWYTKMDSFTKMKALYQNIVIAAVDDKSKITIDAFQALINMQEDARGLWSGPLSLTASNLNLYSKRGGKPDYIGEVYMNVDTQGYDIEKGIKYVENLNALNESNSEGDAPSFSPDHITALYKLVTNAMIDIWDGMSTTIRVSDVNITAPAKATQPERNIKFSSFGTTFGMSGFRENDVAMHFAFNIGGLDPAMFPENESDIPPPDLNIDLTLAHLPFKDMIKIGESGLDTGLKNPGMGQMVALQSMMAMPQLMTKAGTTLNITDSWVGNDAYKFVLNGKALADIKAKLGATGEATLTATGLDTLINTVKEQQESNAQNPAAHEKLTKMLKVLSVMQLVGQQSKNAQGQPARIYKFTLDEQGNVLLNGTALQTIIGQTQQ